MKANLKAKLKTLPQTPGVYFYRDKDGKVIYVGKAANLKNRVRSYFAKSANHDAKTVVLISEIAAVEWMTCESELDALFLESEMIKRYRPQYNIDLKDEKHYLYVKINFRAKAPSVVLVRRPLDDGATYFGPYLDALGLRRALRFLRKIFPYNTHTLLPKRVCLDYHLGLCPGLEEGKTPMAEYRQHLAQLSLFLRGERVRLVGRLEKEMRLAAKTQHFEAAAKLRNQVYGLKSLAKQIVFSQQERFDIAGDQALNGLAKLLNLKGRPRRIEAYDISHLAGTDNVASMIVFSDGVSAKSEYRKFKMRLVGNDDFAHMREVIGRRFSGGSTSKWPKPDLILIDGGKGQLAAALSVLDEKGITMPAIGLAKREEKIIKRDPDFGLTPPTFRVIDLPRESEVLKLVQRIRDESHRFAINYHTLLRSKRQTASVLDTIPGIGPATRKKLVRHFGSFRGVQAAAPAELAAVVGNKKAAALRQYL